MYGKTSYNMLSCFIREEVPDALIERDAPRRPMGYQPSQTYGVRQYREPMSREFNRRPEIMAQPKERRGAESYGIETFAAGTRVMSAVFGNGTVVSSRSMGGDVLYEVKFDNGQTKKLMATFAKLRRI